MLRECCGFDRGWFLRLALDQPDDLIVGRVTVNLTCATALQCTGWFTVPRHLDLSLAACANRYNSAASWSLLSNLAQSSAMVMWCLRQ